MAQPEIALLLELVLDLKKDQNEIKQVTNKNSVILEEHIRRTELAEARLERLEKKDQMLTGFFKISMALLGLAGAVVGILSALKAL